GQFLYHIAHDIARDLSENQVRVELPSVQQFENSPSVTFEFEFLKNVGIQLGERRVLLMLDEFEALSELITSQSQLQRILKFFRHLMQHSPLLFLIAGTHKLRRLTGDYWSVFFNLAVRIDIGILTEPEACRLITEPIKEWFSFDRLAVDLIWRVT